jgi:hypothetical protein
MYYLGSPMAGKGPHVKVYLSAGLLAKFKSKVPFDATSPSMQAKLLEWIAEYTKDVGIPAKPAEQSAKKLAR